MIIDFDVMQAILSLRPDSGPWSLVNNTVTWDDASVTMPTDSEIEAEMARLDAIYDSNAYQRDRAREYPRVKDQLDDIYHNGIDAWKATIKVTKDKYPKG
jgi:hypothetical protein